MGGKEEMEHKVNQGKMLLKTNLVSMEKKEEMEVQEVKVVMAEMEET